MRDFDFQWGDYVSVTEQRKRAGKQIATLRKQGRPLAPVSIQGRTIASSFWGKSWCANLERYSDFASRLPRGRSYVRNGCVIDLQIEQGEIAARVSGGSLYHIKIAIAPVAAKRWQAICRDCSGTIDSLVELLQGRLAKSVMDRVCREGDGLFPTPDEIKLSCSCPDWADMCKHVAAALYGVGARLDEAPQLLFLLRGVDAGDLLAGAGQESMMPTAVPDSRIVLESGGLAALFGLDIADSPEQVAPAIEPRRPSSPKPSGAAKLPAQTKSHAQSDKRRRTAKAAPQLKAASKGRKRRPTRTKR
jgi:uncharacterized Zn finger protein